MRCTQIMDSQKKESALSVVCVRAQHMHLPRLLQFFLVARPFTTKICCDGHWLNG